MQKLLYACAEKNLILELSLESKHGPLMRKAVWKVEKLIKVQPDQVIREPRMRGTDLCRPGFGRQVGVQDASRRAR